MPSHLVSKLWTLEITGKCMELDKIDNCKQIELKTVETLT